MTKHNLSGVSGPVLELIDRFHHLTGGGPQTLTNLDGSPREQKHAREVVSMLLVFTK